jgi:hypothetical protein
LKRLYHLLEKGWGKSMIRSDFWLIVVTGIISGALLFVGGILATYHYAGYSPVLDPFAGPIVVYPYAAYSLKLLGAGAILSLVDLALCLASPPPPSSARGNALKTKGRNL